ncbi:hypothetical protein R1sor_022546 [Riccia sorocarpa]|uniref:Uncharacterized protein n=1 Tax=Riccia sorocarpa TaxID=122646 RepID=A0ABD3GK55_9MARC
MWPCIHFMSWLRSRGEDYTHYIIRLWFQKSLQQCYSKTVPAIIDTELPMRVTCRAPPPAIRTGRARVVRIPNGGPSSRAPIAEFEYPVFQEPRVIPPAATGGDTTGVVVVAGEAVCRRKLCPSAESDRFSAGETYDFSAEEEADDLSVEEELPTRSKPGGPVFAKAYAAFRLANRAFRELEDGFKELMSG